MEVILSQLWLLGHDGVPGTALLLALKTHRVEHVQRIRGVHFHHWGSAGSPQTPQSGVGGSRQPLLAGWWGGGVTAWGLLLVQPVPQRPQRPLAVVLEKSLRAQAACPRTATRPLVRPCRESCCFPVVQPEVATAASAPCPQTSDFRGAPVGVHGEVPIFCKLEFRFLARLFPHVLPSVLSQRVKPALLCWSQLRGARCPPVVQAAWGGA